MVRRHSKKMSVKAGIYKLFNIPFYRVLILNGVEVVDKIDVRMKGEDTIRIGNNTFILPKPGDNFLHFREGMMTIIPYDLENALGKKRKRNDEIKTMPRGLIEEKKINNHVVNPNVLQQILEDDSIEKALRKEKSFFDELKPILIIGVGVVIIYILFWG